MTVVDLIRYESVASTNDTAKSLFHDGRIGETSCVVAREQTAGRGTRGRKWASPKDAGIYLSVIELPGRTGEENGNARLEPTAFTLAAGVACVECLRRLLGICVELKPINDLYADGGKLGGILAEAVIERGRMMALITGIGINLRRAERAVEGAQVPVVSLEDLVGSRALAELDPDELAAAIAEDVHSLNLAVLRGEAERVRWAWEQYRIPDAQALKA